MEKKPAKERIKVTNDTNYAINVIVKKSEEKLGNRLKKHEIVEHVINHEYPLNKAIIKKNWKALKNLGDGVDAGIRVTAEQKKRLNDVRHENNVTNLPYDAVFNVMLKMCLAKQYYDV